MIDKTRDGPLTWILTYILDPEDLVHDKIPYVGYLDDQYILKTGLYLFHRKAR